MKKTLQSSEISIGVAVTTWFVLMYVMAQILI